ncbi:hypothetical protein ACIRRH_43665 [Kitasatospora sp. NPDC101235]|uniref:hypothetical protein n=1 Tax=Kitasatospora sp. NPDC101235 TaxID=3364101 RepID=UPI00382B585C
MANIRELMGLGTGSRSGRTALPWWSLLVVAVVLTGTERLLSYADVAWPYLLAAGVALTACALLAIALTRKR